MGFSVYMTEEELDAIADCISQTSTSLESCSEEYFNSTEPILEASNKFYEKCLKSRAKTKQRALVQNIIKEKNGL